MSPQDHESTLLYDVLREFGRGKNFRISRNNTGVGKYCTICERAHREDGHPAYRVVKYGMPGAPDILGILGPDGRAFGIEVKSEIGATSNEQRAYHAMIKRFGGDVVVVRSMNEATEWMKGMGGQW